MGRRVPRVVCSLWILAILALLACSSSHRSGGDDGCTDPAPSCRISPAPDFGRCCGPTERAASCVDGTWSCDSGFLLETECTRITPSGYCDGPPPDSGTAPGEDAGAPACSGLGAAACFGSAECAPVFDDRCCPSCTMGPCADCFDPTYVECVPFGDCRAPACGVVPAWGCFPSAPDCTGAVPMALDSCSAFGCVPSYPPGEGEPSLADAVCVPIVGASCTATCRRTPPICPSGTVPEGDGSCYTDRCIPAFVCD